MKRVALVSSEPIRPNMGGIGIRYADLARRLPALGFEVVLVCPRPDVGSMQLPLYDVRPFQSGRLAQSLAGCDVVIAQGELANHVVHETPRIPTAIDLYDPWLVENLHYAPVHGTTVYRHDHASWVLQMGRGDFFLCASEEQRLFYLGFLAARGRVNPDRLSLDPDLRGLIDVVPFGVPETVPEHQPYLPADAGRRILFGGIYDWYDPWTLLHAVEKLPFDDWNVLFMHNPNPDTTPQGLALEVAQWCGEREPWKSRVQFLDWVPAERRFDLMRDVAVLVAPHNHTLETELSMRTRFLDALAAGCPVVMTQGDALSRLVEQHDAGWTVPAQDPQALAQALTRVLGTSDAVAEQRRNARKLATQLGGPLAFEKLAGFLRNPALDATKEKFAVAQQVNTSAADMLIHGARRVLSRLVRV